MGAAVWKKLCLNIECGVSSSISSKVSWFSRCSLLNFRVQLLLKIADFTQHTAATASIKKADNLFLSFSCSHQIQLLSNHVMEVLNLHSTKKLLWLTRKI